MLMTRTLRNGQAFGRTFCSPQCSPLLFLYQTPTLRCYFSDSPFPLKTSQGQPDRKLKDSTDTKSYVRRVDTKAPRIRHIYIENQGTGFESRQEQRTHFDVRDNPGSFASKDSSLSRDVYGGKVSPSLPSVFTSRSHGADASYGKPFEPDLSREHEDSFRKSEEDFVPFESSPGVKAPLPTDTIANASTMTDSERKAFARLQNLGVRSMEFTGAPAHSKSTSSKDGLSTLDDILNEAISNVRTELDLEENERERTPPKRTTTKTPDVTRHKRAQEGQANVKEAAPIDHNRIRREHLLHINRQLKLAETDMEFWSILHREVLDPVSSLKLDEDTRSITDEDMIKRRDDTQTTDRETKMHNFPHLLVQASQSLNYKFPASPLGLSILPEIQGMGPSVYALGASAKLFNHSMAIHFQKYTDPDGVVELLEEMEKQFIEPDEETFRLLSNITYTWKKVRCGDYGEAVKVLWETKRFKKSLNALSDWKVKIERIIREQRIRAARQRMTLETPEQGRESEGDVILNNSTAHTILA